MYKNAAISPIILMHLMMAKYAETCCAIHVLTKDIQLETAGSSKVLKFEFQNF